MPFHPIISFLHIKLEGQKAKTSSPLGLKVMHEFMNKEHILMDNSVGHKSRLMVRDQDSREVVYSTCGPFNTQHNPLCHQDDSFALLHFTQSISIIKSVSISVDPSAYPKVASWNASSSDCCLWDGVTCDDNTCRVISLDLSSSFLSGFINTSNTLFRLVHLQTLNLAGNYFNKSQIPSAIGLLSRLTYLNLSNTEFTGQIPLEFSNLTKLNSLDLSRNYFLEILKPGLASLVQNLTDLKQLHLSQVNISSPVHVLANFSSLTSLLLENCQLQGEFSACIFKLPNLQFLSVQYNTNLSGYLPGFFRRSPLKELRLAGTNFSGEMPNSIRYLESLNHLDISYCNFSGSMLSSISNLSQLLHLELSGNNFSAGSISSWIGNLTQLERLYMRSTQLTGRILSWLMNLTQLTLLDLSENNFSARSSRLGLVILHILKDCA
ncbi:receptor-like protein 7 [Cornus florida]|uniref:receptor-like protein 7 n=1 Tax=Cornus florida TaxID=4283 RepID=UPI0028998061|nr:receptor-like protein 7 [Cornus florida]